MFAVVRHPDIEALGIIPESALDMHRVRGWYRVSHWAPEPSYLYPPEFAEVYDDLDAEPPQATTEVEVAAEHTPPAEPAPTHDETEEQE